MLCGWFDERVEHVSSSTLALFISFFLFTSLLLCIKSSCRHNVSEHLFFSSIFHFVWKFIYFGGKNGSFAEE